MPDHDTILNTIHMTSAWGEMIPGLDLGGFLPAPNLWERLKAAGVEPIVVQPGNFAQTPLTRVLYRGARFEGYWSPDEAVEVTLDVSNQPGRLVFLYVPYVDYAAHISGQESTDYLEALTAANDI
jgi:predicted AlkP superfamily pyrophosphatase or phosphodiesterase